MTCQGCKGRKWMWVGVALGEAERYVCQVCQGAGTRGGSTLLIICILAPWVLGLGITYCIIMLTQMGS